MREIITPIVIDLGQNFNAEERANILASLENETSIHNAKFSEHVSRFLMVDYDASRMNARALKRSVDQYLDVDGPATCLIGM